MDYALNSPTKRQLYIPEKNETPHAPVEQPKKNTELDQTHRNLQWLFHKPQEHAVFPVQSQAVKIEKKK
jgi:hypothetical protein